MTYTGGNCNYVHKLSRERRRGKQLAKPGRKLITLQLILEIKSFEDGDWIHVA